MVLTGAVAALMLFTGCTGKDAVDQGSGQYRFVSGTSLGKTYDPGERKKAGDFTGELLNGGTLSLSQLAGKVVVINFWAVWCGPCKTETPAFDSVYRAYQGQGRRLRRHRHQGQRSRRAGVRQGQQDQLPDRCSTSRARRPWRSARSPRWRCRSPSLMDKHGRVAAVYLERLQPADLQPVLDQAARGELSVPLLADTGFTHAVTDGPLLVAAGGGCAGRADRLPVALRAAAGAGLPRPTSPGLVRREPSRPGEHRSDSARMVPARCCSCSASPSSSSPSGRCSAAWARPSAMHTAGHRPGLRRGHDRRGPGLPRLAAAAAARAAPPAAPRRAAPARRCSASSSGWAGRPA